MRNKIQHGAIAWMASNPVAANLIMLLCLVGGLLMTTRIKQEVFPEFESEIVTVTVAYPGASPEEVEKGIVLAIEERVTGLDGIKKVTSSSVEGAGTVTVEALEGTDMERLAQDVKGEVDRISSFPEDAETPRVVIASNRRRTMSIAIYGDMEERILREMAETVRDDLLQDPEITQIDLSGARDLEISIEISQDTLRAHGLTLRQVAEIIGNSALELPGGSVKTSQGEILVRVKDRRELGKEFANLPIISSSDGSMVRLEDLGRITDGFEDTDLFALYNNQPAILLDIYRVGDQTPISVSNAVKRHMERLKQILPPGVNLAKRNDSSDIFRQRMDLLTRNGLMGLCLVFILLALFLEIRLAFWVSMGIPISILGSFLILPGLGVSINMVSMFAFIITLGIVVDDAIVVGENVYQYKEQGLSSLKAATSGAREVVMPVTFSVLTNVVAFVPMLFVPGVLGRVFGVLPAVVVSVFLISLVESLFVLPSHLGHLKSGGKSRLSFLHNWQAKFSAGFMRVVNNFISPLLMLTIRLRYLTLAIAVAVLLATLGYVASGRMGIVMFPKVESDYAYVELAMPFGSPVARTEAAINRMVGIADELAREHGGDELVEGIFSQVGTSSGGHQGSVRVFLTPPEMRTLPTAEFTRLWRERVGEIAGAEYLKFESDRGGPGSGAALTIELSHRSTQILEKAGEDLAKELGSYAQVSDIDDGFSAGKTQLDFRIRPEGRSLGLTSQDVARQIRAAFYGAEALRQQRGRNEIKVMVRLPEGERVSLQNIEDFLVRTPAGTSVLLREVADVTKGHSYTSIDRRNGRRIISVTADVTPPSEAAAIINAIKDGYLPKLQDRYQGLEFSFEGKQADIKEGVGALLLGLGMACLGIFALLAVPLRSYVQPLIIMTSIPFGIVGAVFGHLVMGYSLSLVSLFGIVALSGVVVNASLVLIDCANGKRRVGQSALASIHQASVQRFRPILLTTVTTFGGLAPMIWETSRQARFLIPMALSLGFGIVFSTFITLGIVPSLYMVLEDLKRFGRSLVK
ncbi:Multidrug efflux pump subunit AcrB [Desulfomicrobium norvegicum]|uniref:Multidrug efflux pump subunit AcrB n=1 Tax=Desulfomicrobium norvegicum (strain DSM 1741 / NCIMB 8310) TaxID=52561 RepID=A0A8G2F4P4_DESNO|nr:efflux RND transporter permease subunit [Desulfomicrobium norvegicum]SFL32129.1 Multidrug efflux pump subunit AcrB [Desulfomicrobium norvegicum]